MVMILKKSVDAIDRAKAIFEKPSVIIAHTIPGKGVHDFMSEDLNGTANHQDLILKTRHLKVLKQIKELRTLGGKIISEHQ
jgi:transketolase